MVVGDVDLSEDWDEHQRRIILSEMWEQSNSRRNGKKYFVGELGLTVLSEIRAYYVGELGCRRCRNVVEMGRTPNGDNMSEKREVQGRRITLSEVRTVGEMGCRRSEWTPNLTLLPYYQFIAPQHNLLWYKRTVGRKIFPYTATDNDFVSLLQDEQFHHTHTLLPQYQIISP